MKVVLHLHSPTLFVEYDGWAFVLYVDTDFKSYADATKIDTTVSAVLKIYKLLQCEDTKEEFKKALTKR